MKRDLLFLLFVLCLNGMTAQVLTPVEARDYRAVLDPSGRIDEISVSHKGNLFLTNCFGEVYYTSSIDSNWHTMKVAGGLDDLERISFSMLTPPLLQATSNKALTISPMMADARGREAI